MKYRKHAVVTGASQGLGKAFAQELAKRGYPLVLTSLSGQGLEQLGQKLASEYQVEVQSFEADFSVGKEVLDFCDWVNECFEISVLINNAGTGGTRSFEKVSSAYIDRIIQVNIRALSLLTHKLLPNLMKQNKAYILNVSSIAAFSPVGYKTVYPASKTFVHSFSIGLAQELKDKGVTVSVINPGAMKTNPEITARIESQGFMGKLTLLAPSKVAQKSLDGMFRGKTFISINPVSRFISMLLPQRIKVPLMTRIVKRELGHA